MSKRRSFSTILLLACILANGCRHELNLPSIDKRLRAQIENKAASDESLLTAISHLGRVSEPPGFWLNIANSSDYSRKHRSRCVMALFRRHATDCTSVRQLAERIAPAKWLQDADIDVVETLAGSIPITGGLDRTVFVIRVFPGTQSAVYVSVLGEMERGNFSETIRGLGGKANGVIMQIGFADDYEQWFYKKGNDEQLQDED